jgi:hypothetical protein
MIRTAVAVAALIGGLYATGGAEADLEHAAPILVTPETYYRPPTTTTTTTPPAPVPTTAEVVWVETTTVAPPPTVGSEDARCGEWWPTALAAGWPEHLLEELDAVLWGESRCEPDVVSSTGDWGLAQINWTAHGDRVEALGFTRDDLLVPAVNLLVARQVYLAAESAWWCGWEPWSASVDWRRFCREETGS